MKKLSLVLALVGLCFTGGLAFAGAEDCEEDQQWNEDTQQCEAKSD